MHDYLTYKTKQFFVLLIKLSIIIGAGYFIYFKLVKTPTLSFPVFLNFISKNNVFSYKNLFLLISLTVCNWYFEILKWKHLITSIKPTSFKQATAQSLGALTASLFTPNRIGEYGAKALYFKPPFRKKVMLANLLSNLLQMGVTLGLGCIGLYVFTQHHQLNIGSTQRMACYALILVLGLGILVVYYLKKQKPSWSVFMRLTKALQLFPKSTLSLAFLFALCRYTVFSFQFYSLLCLFKVDLPYLESMSIITSTYLIASVIPSIFIFDVIVKGSVAVFLFSFVQVNELIVLSTTTCMWILNFVVPSSIGGLYVINFKIPED